MKCILAWDDMGETAWREKLAEIRRSTLLQTWEYGEAMRMRAAETPRRALIFIEGNKAGIAQILEFKALGGLVHKVSLDRGPLWFEGYGTSEHRAAFLNEFSQQFCPRLLRRIRIIPEWGDEVSHSFRQREGNSYQTIWLDITKNEDDLRASLDKKWRNALAKAERSNLEITWDESGRFLPWLLKVYQIDKMQRHYEGASPILINLLHKKGMKMLAGKVVQEGRDIAGALFLLHGNSATYQIGWSSDEGRAVNAHNLLLWQALQSLREHGIKDLDLGGVNEENQGLAKFKEGMGGEKISLSGILY